MKTEVSTTPRRSPRKHPGSLRSWRTRTSPRKLSRKPYSDRQRRTLGTRDVVLESGDLEGQSKSTVVETGIAVDHDRQQESVQGKHSMVDVRNSKLARQGRSERHKQVGFDQSVVRSFSEVLSILHPITVEITR